MGTIVAVALSIALFLVFAWVARRLLGVGRLSATKTVISAAVGLGVGFVIQRLLEVRGGVDRDLAVVSGLVLGLLFTMVMILLFEATGSPTDPRFLCPPSGFTHVTGEHSVGPSPS